MLIVHALWEGGGVDGEDHVGRYRLVHVRIHEHKFEE